MGPVKRKIRRISFTDIVIVLYEGKKGKGKKKRGKPFLSPSFYLPYNCRFIPVFCLDPSALHVVGMRSVSPPVVAEQAHPEKKTNHPVTESPLPLTVHKVLFS